MHYRKTFIFVIEELYLLSVNALMLHAFYAHLHSH